jgi:hypothetical protein
VTVLMVQYRVKEEAVPAVETSIHELFSVIDAAQPKGLRYAMCKLPDGVTFLGVVQFDDGADNPLLGIAAATEFRANLKQWVVGDPPAPQPLQIVGSYGLFT